MDLGSPALLALLALLPAALIAWWRLWRARRLHQHAVGAQIEGRRRGRTLSRALLLVALALIAIAAARPMWNAGEQTLGLSDFSLVVALDVSLSMAAEDVGGNASPNASGSASAPVSRFAAAQAEIRRLIDGRRGDRVGLVIFAGDAFLRFPLTRDHEAAIEVLEALQPGEALVPPGSDIGRAIDLAATTIARASAEDGGDRIRGAIAVVSDGETHSGDAIASAAAARELGLQVFAVGVGADRGANIPLPQTGWLKNDVRTGSPVVTRLDIDQLERIADAGGGRLITLDSPGAMSSMNADLAALDLVREVVVEETALAEQFQWFAGAAGLILIASAAARVFGWSPGKTPGKTLGKTLGGASLASLAGALLLTGGCAGPGIEQANREGVAHYEAGEYAAALDDWREAQRLSRHTDGGADPRLYLNAGRALHQLGEFDRAETETLAALRSDSAQIRATAWFHAGNHRWANDDLLGARAAYIEALRAAPSLLDAKINLEIVNAILDSLQEDQPDDQGQQPGDDGQQSQSGASQSASASEDSQSDAATEGAERSGQSTDDAPEGAPTALPGQGDGAPPTTPTFSEAQSLIERREQALDDLQSALDELPLEEASLEQALAVLDALRAVPGERLAAGRLEIEGRPLDW